MCVLNFNILCSLLFYKQMRIIASIFHSAFDSLKLSIGTLNVVT